MKENISTICVRYGVINPMLYSWYFEYKIDLDYDIIWEETIFTDNILSKITRFKSLCLAKTL